YPLIWIPSGWATVANPSLPARFAAKPFMHQHLEEGLVSDALSRCEFSGLGYIGFGQSQRNLDAGDLVQLTDKRRAPRRASFLPGSGPLLLYELAALAAVPPVRLLSFVDELGHDDRFLFHRFTPLASAGRGNPSSARHPVRTR